MSMAMRRQLGMAPNKSPSKAGSAAARESRSFIVCKLPSSCAHDIESPLP